MALTPAREYYGSQIADGLDPSEQWSRKKQTKEQKRAAKKAKLDPANQKSALDVMKERERKRKRELGMEDPEHEGERNGENGEAEESSAKRQKVEHDEEAKRRAKVEKRKEKRAVKKERSDRKKAKAEAKKSAKQGMDLDDLAEEPQQTAPVAVNEDGDVDGQPEIVARDVELDAFDASRLADVVPQKEIDTEVNGGEEVGEASSVPSSPAADSPAFDFETTQSTASSSSSILPPSIPEQPQEATPTDGAPPKPTIDTALASTVSRPSSRRSDPPSGISSPKIQLPNIDQAELQERLRLRIEELRARRKADGPDGKPAKSRQELLDQRRKKEEQRKATKKEQRRKAKEDEQRKREEQLRGSASPLSVDMFSSRPQQAAAAPAPETNFSFSRLAFEDGTAADPTLTSLADPRKRKGPQDPRTALEAAQKKQSRIAGLDAEKQAEIAEKDMWLNARKRAHGERVRDDTSLLKKALKRKEKAKGKSGEEWHERQEAVVRGREMKQKKREGNLLKRREEKGGGSKGKKKGGSGGQKGGKGGGGGGGAKKGKASRPGFEGRRLKA
ncbi:hypothetical protein B0A55_09721 [Friedmanniomyces simplex]|uniref:Ribosomal RNA-processing protein 14/surfeit locus protein 6 C-terminal domain-containing protein n=1 Tax=Friedmanniomyces simplex TaxID=329884 RepID=A0A4U0WW16_9PEZI|nr:hypothetical protein B0A55_09721 [Friedmanniomyces simplex]